MLKKSNILGLLVFSFVLAFPAYAQNSRIKIKIDPSLGQEPVSGRLLILMTANSKPLERIDTDFTDPEAVYVTGVEINNATAGKTIEVDPNLSAFPRAFSMAPAGNYQIMALLDRDHSYTYDGAGAGDFYSPVIKVSWPAAETELTISRQIPERATAIKNLQIVEFESPLLSAFWGRPIKMQAGVLLPPSYDKSKTQKYPTVYNIHGYGGNHLKAFGAPKVYQEMIDGKRPEVINVYLNGQFTLGHHVFADSANNGPWGTALVKEFIPSLEKQFRMDGKPAGRFLTGHSSGGWATLWVMINHPDFFGGTWSTSPDPVDFRSFTGPDLTKYPPQNAYADAGGKDYNLVRMNGKELMSMKQYAQQETVTGYFGGQIASFNAVFSPKGADGQPMKLFDIESGRIDPLVQKAWEKYDISRVLRTNWKTLGPKLKGKLHIIVGTADTFHLDEPVRLLEAELKKLGSDARIEYLEGRDHFNLYEGGLSIRITNEIYAVARPKAKAAGH